MSGPAIVQSDRTVQGVLACDATEAKRLRSELAQLHRDPSWLDATVARLPVPALCIAAALAGRGGLLRLTELEQLVEAKFQLTPTEIDAGVFALMRELLVAPLASGRASCSRWSRRRQMGSPTELRSSIWSWSRVSSRLHATTTAVARSSV